MKTNILGTLHEDQYTGYFTWRPIYRVLDMKKNIQGTLHEDQYTGYFTWRPIYKVLYMKTNIHFWSYLGHFFLEWEIFQTILVENIKTHILYSVTFFENRAVYEMWKNIIEWCRSKMTIWRMRIACWITKATNTHTQVV